MHGLGVEFEIAPSRSSVITVETGAVESEEYERFFHDVFCLEKNGELGISVGDHIRRVGPEFGVGGGGEDDRRLGLLSMITADMDADSEIYKAMQVNGLEHLYQRD